MNSSVVMVLLPAGSRRFTDVNYLAATDQVLVVQQRDGSRTLFAPGAWLEAELIARKDKDVA